ncbi:MAG: hypothetical protein SYR96_40070 [Actinomycetota bacterium]|nr:hypothetical protein [Actinomycetota bacterium]
MIDAERLDPKTSTKECMIIINRRLRDRGFDTTILGLYQIQFKAVYLEVIVILPAFLTETIANDITEYTATNIMRLWDY